MIKKLNDYACKKSGVQVSKRPPLFSRCLQGLFFIDKYIIFSLIKHKLISGGDLRYILKILEYKSSKTAEIYTHITKKRNIEIKESTG